MENLFPEIPAESAGLLTLGIALGENVAFGVVSGRTAAAQAACLQRVRQEKRFQALESTWEQFCPKYPRCAEEAEHQSSYYRAHDAEHWRIEPAIKPSTIQARNDD
jgi:hypothetical protein